MVADTRKTPHPGTFKPVNLPESVAVEEGPGGVPAVLKGTRRQPVAAVECAWRLDDEWWRTKPLSRIYFAVVMASGQRLILFKDLTDNRWFRQTY